MELYEVEQRVGEGPRNESRAVVAGVSPPFYWFERNVGTPVFLFFLFFPLFSTLFYYSLRSQL